MTTDQPSPHPVSRDGTRSDRPPSPANVQPYDFGRPDRIPKDQLRAIHLLHENFARTLAPSLSAYLRAYVIVNLVSVEQLSFAEFCQCLPSPTMITALNMRPFEGSAVLEMNPSLVFPILEMLLGGAGRIAGVKLEREVTEIEQNILEGVYRIILRDLKDAWQSVAALALSVETVETQAQMLQILAPNEAVVAVGLEVRIGDNVGMLNLAIPSIIIKMLRQKFDQHWSFRRSQSSEEEQARILNLARPAILHCDVRLSGPSIRAADLLRLEAGQVLNLDYPVESSLSLEINRKRKWEGFIVDNGRRRTFVLDRDVSGA